MEEWKAGKGIAGIHGCDTGEETINIAGFTVSVTGLGLGRNGRKKKIYGKATEQRRGRKMVLPVSGFRRNSDGKRDYA